MDYKLTTPCGDCPFRNDRVPFLTHGRVKEIATSLLLERSEFPCHKTLDYARCTDDTECDHQGNYCARYVDSRTQHCAGALIILEHANRPHQMMRICERLGAYDRTALDMNAPVYPDLGSWMRAHRNTRARRLVREEETAYVAPTML